MDDEGEVWVKPGDETRFEQGHEGDHLFYPFQCDLCWFRNLKGRDPVERNGQDTLFLITIRRIILLGMWGSEPSTTNAHRLNVIRGVKICQLVGLPPNYPPLRPYPIGDSFGYGLAVEMMLRSLDSGDNLQER